MTKNDLNEFNVSLKNSSYELINTFLKTNKWKINT